MTGLLQVPFFEDELLTSFVSRMARANGRADLHRFCRDLGLDRLGIIRGDVGSIANLEKALSQPAGSLTSQAFYKVGTRHIRFRDMIFAAGSIGPVARKFCPHCIHEDQANRCRMPGTRVYARLAWAMYSYNVCERHGDQLVLFEDVNRSCKAGNDIAMSRASSDFCSQIDLWHPTDQSEVLVVAPSSPSFERFIADRLSGRTGHGELLDKIPLPAAIEVSQLLGLAVENGQRFRWQIGERLETSSVAARGFQALKRGEIGVNAVLDQIAARADNNRSQGSYGTLSEVLSRRPETHGAIKLLLAKHAANNQLVLAQSESCDDVSVAEIAATVGLPPRIVCRYLVQEGLLTKIPTQPASVMVTSSEAAKAVEALADAASFDDVQSILGCSLSELRSLARSGLVSQIMGPIPTHSGRGTDLYSRSSLLRLRGSVRGLCGRPTAGFIPFRTVILEFGLEAGEVLSWVTESGAAIASFDPSYPLFTGLTIDTSALMAERQARTLRHHLETLQAYDADDIGWTEHDCEPVAPVVVAA